MTPGASQGIASRVALSPATPDPVPSSPRQTFYKTDPTQGTLRLASGARLAVVPLDFLRAVHVQLFEHFSDNCQDLLYRSGYEQGLQEMVQLNEDLQEQYGGGSFDLWQMDAKFILETWWSLHAQAGWGRCTFDLTALTRSIVVIDLEDNPIPAALGHSEYPICHFFAGLFAGVVSFYERAERHATELECRAVAGPRCRFVVAAGGDVDSAEGLRQQGVATAEILGRLRP